MIDKPPPSADTTLQSLLEWGHNLPDFEPGHASDALTLIRGYTEVLPDASGLELFALDLTYFFWLDDRFDARLAQSDQLVDWQALVQATGPDAPLRSIDALAFAGLRGQMEARTSSKAELELWSLTAIDIFRAWNTEERLSRGQLELSYAEYLDNGIASTTVPHLLATASLLYDLEMPASLQAGPLASLVRNLSIVSRLQNDLYSVERDRREGCRANALLVLEPHMSPGQARSFVESQRQGHERLLNRDCAQLGTGNPFSRLARAMLEAQERWYLHRTTRYDAPAG